MSFIGLVVALCTALMTGASNLEYNEKEALAYFKYQRVSYCTKPRVLSWDCGDVCEEASIIPGAVRFFESRSSGVQGYVARPSHAADGKCIASFTGIAHGNPESLSTMLLMVPWHADSSWCPRCAVSAGEANIYAELRDGFIAAIHELECHQLGITGHSFGGAIAALASLDAASNLNVSVGPVYTFGAARAGNEAFVNAHIRAAEKQGRSPPMWRIVKHQDCEAPVYIPREPGQLFGHYTHVPVEVYYTDLASAHWKVCPSSGVHENQTCSAAVPLSSCAPPGSLKFHQEHEIYLNTTIGGYYVPMNNTKCYTYPEKSKQTILVM